MSVHTILESNRVAVVCTTDAPPDSLEHHRALSKTQLKTRVYPAWRPDRVLGVDQLISWNAWIDTLGAAGTLGSLLERLIERLDYFHANGCRLSDHGLNHLDAAECTQAEAAQTFDFARAGKQVTPEAAAKFRSFMMVWLGEQYHVRGWVMQLHLGAQRNNSSRQLLTLGPDTGFDSIGDWPQAAALGRYLDRLDTNNRLPKTILYNLNPADNYVLATMLGNFQDGSVPGKIQFGSGWWFLDQKEGMEWQLNALSSLGLLSRFVGMLTDSRCFLSYSRHEYFRRILCELIGRDVVNGELPNDLKLLGNLVRAISFGNARDYFEMEPGRV